MSDPSSPDANVREAALAVSSPTPSPLHASSVSTPPLIPDHELLRRIGAGSYGEVWLARNVFGTHRAVKIVYRSRFDNNRPFQREFEGIQKFEPISRSHESQVDILQVGRADGYFYYVMELADDAGQRSDGVVECRSDGKSPEQQHSNTPTLQEPNSYAPRTLKSELQKRARLPFDECLRVALALTTALKHLHEHGLIHRDIKPSNIIFVGGVPKLADIGLVTDLDATMSFVGTEGYLAPEGRGSVQADIYSLGKVFYEMATGKDRLDFPEPTTNLGESPDRAALVEFNEIILKACAPDPRERYQRAEQVHSDVLLLQAGKSLQRKRRLQRGLTLAVRAGVAAALVALVAFSFSYQSKRARREAFEEMLTQKQPQPSNGSGTAAENALTIRKLPLQAEQIYSVSRDGQYVAYQPTGKSQIAVFETLTGRTNVAAQVEEIPSYWVVFSPDGRQIAYDSGASSIGLANTDGSGTSQLYRVKDDRSEGVWVPGWSGDGQQLVIATWDDKTKRKEFTTLDLKSGEKEGPVVLSPEGGGGWQLSWSGRYLAFQTAGPEGPEGKRKIRVLDLKSGTISTLVEKEVGETVGWAPDDTRFLFRSERSGSMDLWAITVREGKPSGQPELIKGVDGDISLVGVSRDGKFYYREEHAEACSVYVATVDFQTGEVSGQPRLCTERFAGLQSQPVWSEDGQKLMFWIGGNQRVARRFASVSMESGEVADFGVGAFGHKQFLQNRWLRYQWSKHGDFLLVQGTYSATGHQGIHRYDLDSGKVETLIRHRDTPDHDWNCNPKPSPDGNSLYYIRRKFYEGRGSESGFDYDDRIIRRNLRSGEEAVVYQTREKLQIWCPIDLSPDGTQLAVATYGESTISDFQKGNWVSNIKIVDLNNGQGRELIRLTRPDYPHWLDWSADGEWLIYIKGQTDSPEEKIVGTNDVWAISVKSGKQVRLRLPFPNIWNLALHPDGRQLAFSAVNGGGDGVDLWVMEGLMPGLFTQNTAKKN
ncbi:MAG: PD40 domain-containing protein [Verrucomicrobia bacterium]|nr:PD40 domain-containing protein [Verrucomicrobiota bacterium]